LGKITIRIPDDLDFCFTRVIQEIEFAQDIKIPKSGVIISAIEAWILGRRCNYQNYLQEIAPGRFKYLNGKLIKEIPPVGYQEGDDQPPEDAETEE
jgi:hypothetical protein